MPDPGTASAMSSDTFDASIDPLVTRAGEPEMPRERIDDVLRCVSPVAEPICGVNTTRHERYPQGDPRAACLLSALAPSQTTSELIACVDSLTGMQPTIDIALAALVEHCELQRDAAFALFAIARSVGWAALHRTDDERQSVAFSRALYRACRRRRRRPRSLSPAPSLPAQQLRPQPRADTRR